MNFAAELSKFEAGSKEYIFFEKVFEKCGSMFVRKSVEEKQREVRSKLNKAVEEYFQLYILADAVIKSVEQLEKSQEADLDLHSFSEASNHVHSLYLNFVKKYLLPEESQKPKLFGLNQANTQKMYEDRKSESENAAFKKLVEDNINDFCKKLVLCTGGTIFSGQNWKNVFDRTIKDLESKTTLMSTEEAKEQSKKQLRDMIKTYYGELSKGVSLLNKALSLHEQKLQFESNAAEFYLNRCNAVLLKIKFFELKILDATYNQETIPALKKISAQLDQSEEKLKEEQNEKTVELESYLKLGEEYQHYVDEYTCLTKRIREQQWAIDELKSRKSQYGTLDHN